MACGEQDGRAGGSVGPVLSTSALCIIFGKKTAELMVLKLGLKLLTSSPFSSTECGIHTVTEEHQLQTK